jgi:hypothetical protein
MKGTDPMTRKIDSEVRRHLNTIRALCDDVEYALTGAPTNAPAAMSGVDEDPLDTCVDVTRAVADLLGRLSILRSRKVEENDRKLNAWWSNQVDRARQIELNREGSKRLLEAIDRAAPTEAPTLDEVVEQRDDRHQHERYLLTAKAEAHLARTPEQLAAQAEKH